MGGLSLVARAPPPPPPKLSRYRRRSMASLPLRRLTRGLLRPRYCSSSLGKFESLATEVQHAGQNSAWEVQLVHQAATTGGAFDFLGSTPSLTDTPLPSPKRVTIMRHGLSSWNQESRVQGSSNMSTLTDTGVIEAERCQKSLSCIKFDACFSSPISRAKSTAEIMWQGRENPLFFLNSLEEAHLFFLEGMTNADAQKKHPGLYNTWRQDPENFHVNGIYPIRKLWVTARAAWKEILLTPGKEFLVVTHKSILRALICTAVGLGPQRFRAIDVNNGGICVFKFNKKGEAVLQSLNLTAHLYSDHTYQY